MYTCSPNTMYLFVIICFCMYIIHIYIYVYVYIGESHVSMCLLTVFTSDLHTARCARSARALVVEK